MLRVVRLAAVAGGAVLAARSAAAQSPGGTGTLAGTVYDSLLTDRPLAGAEVLVAGTALTARTDGAGRFRLDGVPAGERRVTFFHPALEAVRFGAPTQTVQVRPGQASEVRLLTPSPATVYRAFCAGDGEVKTGVLVGRVRAADTTAGVGGAGLRVGWNTFVVTRRGLERTPRALSAETNADGSFAVCGVPNDVPVLVSVRAPDGTVAAQEVALADRLLGTAFVDLPALPSVPTATAELAAPAAGAGAPAPRPAAPAVAYVRGVVRRGDGRPFAGARVSVAGDALAVASDANGAFVLGVPRAGAFEIEARAIGYRPVRASVTADRGRPAGVALTLSDNVVVLAPTVVRAPRVVAALQDYERRRRAGQGFFITNTDIQARRPYSVADALVMAPGVRTILPNAQMPGASPRIVFQRSDGTAGVMSGSCEPVTYVDGVRLVADPDLGLQLDQVVPRPQDVHGIEIYRSLASIPPQYQPLNSSCGVILIWTNRGS